MKNWLIAQNFEHHSWCFVRWPRATRNQIPVAVLWPMLFLELSAPELCSISLSVSTVFFHTYHILRSPTIAPVLTYSRLKLISHPSIIFRLLLFLILESKLLANYLQLFLDFIKYLASFLCNIWWNIAKTRKMISM